MGGGGILFKELHDNVVIVLVTFLMCCGVLCSVFLQGDIFCHLSLSRLL